MQLLCWRRILRIHIHHEVRLRSEECHLTFCITTVSTMRVPLDELPDGKAIRCFFGGDGQMFAHTISPFHPLQTTSYSRIARGSRKASIPNAPNSRPTPENLKPPQGARDSSSFHGFLRVQQYFGKPPGSP